MYNAKKKKIIAKYFIAWRVINTDKSHDQYFIAP